MPILKLALNVLTNPAFGGIVNVIAVISLYFAIRSWKDGQVMAEATENLKKTSETIEKSLSTHYLSEYPKYIQSVAKLVSEAEDQILILSVIPAVGAYSAPEDWEDLSNMLIKAQRRGVSLSLVTANTTLRHQNHRIQFAPAFADWKSWVNLTENSSKLASLCERYQWPNTKQSAEWFLETVDAMHKHLLTHSYYKAKITYANDLMPLLAWIVDGRRAIFAFNNVHGTPPAFYTHDKAIVDALKGYFERMEYASASEILPVVDDSKSKT